MIGAAGQQWMSASSAVDHRLMLSLCWSWKASGWMVDLKVKSMTRNPNLTLYCRLSWSRQLSTKGCNCTLLYLSTLVLDLPQHLLLIQNPQTESLADSLDRNCSFNCCLASLCGHVALHAVFLCVISLISACVCGCMFRHVLYQEQPQRQFVQHTAWQRCAN